MPIAEDLARCSPVHLRWIELFRVTVPELQLDQGCLPLPECPGLGFAVDERKLQRYIVVRRRFGA